MIFFENLIMNAIILYATAIILKIKSSCIRIVLASTLGSIYAIITYISEIPIYTSAISKGILSIIMVYIGFNPQNMKKMWKQILIFYLTSFVFGGVALYLIYVIKPQNAMTRNGMFVGEYVLKVVFLGAIVAVTIIKISIKIIKTKINSKDMYCNIKIKLNGNVIETSSHIDETFPIGNVLFTSAGEALSKITEPYTLEGYEDAVIKYLKSNNVTVETESLYNVVVFGDRIHVDKKKQ